MTPQTNTVNTVNGEKIVLVPFFPGRNAAEYRKLRIEVEKESDGRWSGYVVDRSTDATLYAFHHHNYHLVRKEVASERLSIAADRWGGRKFGSSYRGLCVSGPKLYVRVAW